jgi:CelD/BcsL family acetyltransferase involved in cellulose biosynthesis
VDAWLAFDAKHPAPTFFARPAWTLALSAALPNLRPYPVHVTVGDRRLLIPLVRGSGGALRWREVTGFPLGTYTCALHEDGSFAEAAEISAALDQLARAYDSVRICLWPLELEAAPSGGWARVKHETSVIDLAGGVEAALDAFDGVSRRMAGQAFRRGVTCERSEGDETDVDAYYAMLRESASRWGIPTPTYPKTLLQALVERGGRDVEIWFARWRGEPIAGGVVLYGGRESFFWSAAMRAEHSRLRPSNALNVALIRAASERGVRWYNLGSSEGLPGVERFKRGLGARIVSYDELSYERAVHALYTHVRASLPARAARIPT